MSDFLYPFIDGDERDAGSLLIDLARSAEVKSSASAELRVATLEALDADLGGASRAMARRFRAGGRLLAFGNGGSSTDAAGVVALFRAPRQGRPLPARSLVADHAVVTALANDVGFDLVFSRQLEATARPPDMALGLSTSGSSINLLRAFEEAKRQGLLSIGIAGYDGGTMATPGAVDHCLVVRSDSVHRIQEAQSAVVFDLWSRVQRLLAEGEADGP